MRNVADRAEPPDPHMRRGLAAFKPNIGDVERRVHEPVRKLDGTRVFRVGHEVCHKGRRGAPVSPGNDFVVLVDPGLEAFCRHGMIEAVPDVVLAVSTPL